MKLKDAEMNVINLYSRNQKEYGNSKNFLDIGHYGFFKF